MIQAVQNFTLIILYFFAYAFIGWVWETAYTSTRQHHWVNAGFLNGPWQPLYGFAVLGVLYLIQPFTDNPLMIYLIAVVYISALEYVTSWGMEKLFHTRWWDYSNVPLNLNGRIALPISLFWGLGGLLLSRYVQPMIAGWVDHTAATYGVFAAIVLIAAFMFDFGFTLANMPAFQEATKKLDQAIDAAKQQADKDWQAHLADQPRLNYVQRRLLNNFRSMKLPERHSSLTELRNAIKRK
ncbi:putative ABC transporter permease [Lacticaseibacillus saniviri]|uniref:ABC transporter permease n=1 Tax=Lacticaseibacillus saniviri JCM 17471 = DSM 24301 TaxID=1293598 RepID=A0A0R2MYJ7_9LACO|nr:putative ABC transporter permease [Lacticaseibacillus saniviri]KRO18452.1 hypothetical protein IV56_GL001586 [Lacticaseibacillus saniviri JCM 17471 = DSM 24301]